MTNRMSMARRLVAVAALAACHGAAQAGRPVLRIEAADRRAGATTSTMLAVARAGSRLVAVGERGTILGSDDGGRSYVQADVVPISATLTGVSFVDAREGWAVGHWGAVLHTTDAGRTWTLQRSDLAHDQPLLAVRFDDARHGVAVGLWSLVLLTEDGGQHWQTVTVPAPAGSTRADLNLYGLFAGAHGELLACAEQGRLLRSLDRGHSWQLLDTGYRGSLWAGATLADGTLLVGGLRGTLLRSVDDGASWTTIATRAKSSITGLAQLPDGRIVATALDGVVLTSRDGLTFVGAQSEDRVPYTAVTVGAAGEPILMSGNGPRPAPQNPVR